MSQAQDVRSEAAAAPAKQRKPRRLRRLWRWIWRGGMVILLLAYLTRNVLLGPWALDYVAEIAYQELGLRLEISGVKGNWYSGIELENIRTLSGASELPVSASAEGDGESFPAEQLGARPKTPLRSVELRSLQLHYSLWDLLRGRDGWLQKIRVEQLGLEIDPRLGADPPAETVAGSTSALPKYLPLLEVGKLSLLVEDEDLWIEVPDLALRSAVSEDGAVEYHIDAKGNAFQRGEHRAPEFAVRTSLAYASGRIEIHRLDVDGDRVIHQAIADLRKLHQGQADFQLQMSLLGGSLQASGNLKDRQLQADLHAKNMDLVSEQRWFDLGLTGSFSADGKIQLPLDDPQAGRAHFSFGSLENGWRKFELQAIQGEVSLKNGWLISDKLHAQGEGLRFEAQGCRLPIWAAQDQALAQGDFHLKVDHLPSWLHRAELELPAEIDLLQGFEARASLSAQGDRVQIKLHELVAQSEVGTLQAEGSMQWPLGDAPLELQVDLHEVAVPQLGVNALRNGRADIALHLSGSAAEPVLNGQIALKDFRLRNPTEDLPPGPYQGRMELTYADGTIKLEPSTLSSPSLECTAQASYPLALNFQQLVDGILPKWNGHLQAQAEVLVNYPEWVDGILLAKFQADGSLNSQGADLHYQLHASAPGLGINGEADLPLNFSSGENASILNPDGPAVLQVELEKLQLETLHAALGPVLAQHIPQAILGNLQGSVQLSGTWSKPLIDAQVHARSLQTPMLEDDPLAYEHILLPDPADLDVHVHYADGVATLTEASASAPQFELHADGSWNGNLDFAALATGKGLEAGSVAGQASLTADDLSWLGALPGIRRIGGSLAAQLHIQGPSAAPELSATWAMQNGELRLDNPSIAAFDQLEFHGSMQDGLLRLEQCIGELGSAPFQATGSIDLSQAQDPQFDLNFDGQDLLLFRRQGVKLRSNAGLHIHGPLSALQVDGKVEITDGRYTQPVDFLLPLLREGRPPSAGVGGIQLFSLAPPLDQMLFNLDIEPGSGFRVKTNVANGMIRPKLRLVGTGEVPHLLGEIYIDSFILMLPAHRIRVDQGVVRFLEENPFVPKLDIHAGFSRYGYDVSIAVTGDIENPIVTLSSVPPLEAEDLLLFTVTGQPPQESASAQEALGTVAVYLAQDWIRRFFGDVTTEDGESLLDRLEIEFGRDATNQGAETIEGRFLLRRDNILQGDELFLTGERDAYSDFNLGLRIRFRFP